MSDQEKIDHPAHYGGAKDPYEAIKVIRAWGLGFALGNAAKYICRAGRKPGEEALDDLKKARWYLDNEVEALGGAQVPKPLSNSEAEALLARGRGEPSQPGPQTVEALAARVGKWRDEAQRLHQILDRCGLGAAPLRERVETLAAAYKEAISASTRATSADVSKTSPASRHSFTVPFTLARSSKK